MLHNYCRACGADPKVMAVRIRCGGAILYGCPNCATFSDTRMHIECFYQSSIVHAEEA
jgi:uncharacterized Zn finger protein